MQVITDVKTQDELLRYLRAKSKEKGMTELARLTGIPRAHLYTVLSEEGNPTLGSLMKVAKALGLSIELKSKS